MKRLVNPLPTGGVPFENEDILTLQNEGFDALKQICAGYTGAFVLSGCGSVLGSETYYGTTQAVGIGFLANNPSINVVVPSGYVWIDGDIKYFPGYAGATPFYIKSDTPTFTRKTLQDGTQKNVLVTTNAVGSNSRPLTGEYITCNPVPEFTLGDMITAKLTTGLAAEINTRQTQNANEVTARTNADTQLSQRINTLADTVDTKATKRCERIDWTDIPLASGWTSNDPFLQTAQWMRDEFGMVHLRGHIVNSTRYTKTNTYGGSSIATLPVGMRPAYRASFTRHLMENYYGSYGNKAHAFTYCYIVLQSNGGFSQDTVFQVNDPDNRVPNTVSSYPTIHLDGISYSSL